MSAFPPDEFDKIDENTARRGTYRGTLIDPSKNPRGALPVIIAGALALMLGIIMYLNAPKLYSPGTSSTKPVASSSASAAPRSNAAASSAAATPSPTVDPSITLSVYNSGAAAGSATNAAGRLRTAGYRVAAAANWTGTAPANSIVYYGSGYEQQAQLVASQLNISSVREISAENGLGSNDVMVVLASDYVSA